MQDTGLSIQVSGDRKTMKTVLALARQQVRLTVQDCSSGHARPRSPSRPSEKSLSDKMNECTSLLMCELNKTYLTGEGYLSRRPSLPRNGQTCQSNNDDMVT
ncbi:hypothetical protein DPMN_085845 [Dreissena polymorpha]|uniref:Uncharacterized protein n=1 Tax=Dreissena polymorpha TaxID=45954 RepID=A0A9D3YFS1_DREPO|nr:hypothetical protein DPMN_085845 [Dreissena polymorpha]